MEINGVSLPIELEEQIVLSALSSRLPGASSSLSSLRLVCTRWNTMACSSVKSLKIKAMFFSVNSFPTSPFRNCETLVIEGKLPDVVPDLCQLFPKIRVLDASSAIMIDSNLAALSLGLGRCVEHFRVSVAGISSSALSCAVSNMKRITQLELPPEGIPLCSSVLPVSSHLKTLRIVSFASPKSFSITIDNNILHICNQLTSVKSIRADFGSGQQLSLSASSEFLPRDHECRFIVGSTMNCKAKSLALWLGTHANTHTKLCYQASLPLLSRVFAWEPVMNEFTSYNQICDFFNVATTGTALGPRQQQVVGDA